MTTESNVVAIKKSELSRFIPLEIEIWDMLGDRVRHHMRHCQVDTFLDHVGNVRYIPLGTPAGHYYSFAEVLRGTNR